MAEKTETGKMEFQGIYAHGVLEGVDYTVAGSGTDDNGNKIKWDSSISLNFSTLEKITKDVGGVELTTMAKRPFIIKIPCQTEMLTMEVDKWNKERGKYLNIRLQPSKNATFKISDDN